MKVKEAIQNHLELIKDSLKRQEEIKAKELLKIELENSLTTLRETEQKTLQLLADHIKQDTNYKEGHWDIVLTSEKDQSVLVSYTYCCEEDYGVHVSTAEVVSVGEK